MHDTGLDSLSVQNLLALHARILGELRTRGVIRTANNPVADYAELLTSTALSLTLAPNSAKGYDATDAEGRRYQIKARRQTKWRKPARFSAIRGIEEHHFDYLVAVLFGEDFQVKRAAILPWQLVRSRVFWQSHVNASVLPLRDTIWTDDSVRDITVALQEVQTNPELGGAAMVT